MRLCVRLPWTLALATQESYEDCIPDTIGPHGLAKWLVFRSRGAGGLPILWCSLHRTFGQPNGEKELLASLGGPCQARPWTRTAVARRSSQAQLQRPV